MIESRPQARDSAMDDRELALRARTHDRAFLELYDRYAERVERYAGARIGNRADVEDVVSAVFTAAFTRIETFDPARGTFGAWLFGIARNTINMHLRSAAHHLDRLESEEPAGNEPTPEDAAIGTELARAVRTAMACLTDDQRHAIALRYLGELSFAEVAQALDRSEGATKMLVKRGLEALRRALEREELTG